MKINDLLKHRSVTACMYESYKLMTNNAKDLLKHTWWAFMLYAFFMALTVFLRSPNKMLHDWGEENMMLSFVLQTCVYLGSIGASFLMGATVWRWITQMPFARTLKRFVVFQLFSALIAFVFTFIAAFLLGLVVSLTGFSIASASLVDSLLVMAAAVVAVFVLLIGVLPMAYMTPHYMLRQKDEKCRLWTSFKCGLRHFGAIFNMGVLAFLIVCVVGIVIYIPLGILIGAQVMAQLGTLEGDPVGTPAYFTPLFISATTLLFFVFTYVVCWLNISYVYLYGSIQNDEMKKKEISHLETYEVQEA